MPYPHNLRLEEIVREGGATPATVGIIAGEIVVGLSRAQIEHLADTPNVWKVSRRDDGLTPPASPLIMRL